MVAGGYGGWGYGAGCYYIGGVLVCHHMATVATLYDVNSKR